MAILQSSGPGGPLNPTIVDIEATNVAVTPDHGLNSVALEVTDQTGSGFRTLFGLDQAVTVALQIAAAVARLRGLPGVVQ